MRVHRIVGQALLALIPTTLALYTALVALDLGRIEGFVRDNATGDPLIGVSVALVGTDLGAITDVDGAFVINHVPPGTYSLKITAIGFQTLRVDSVVVVSDLTSSCNARLIPDTLNIGDKIVVEAQSQTIDKFEVSSATKIKRAEMQRKPGKTVSDVIRGATGAGESENGKIHVKGGRAGEVAYIVDGVNISPAFPPAHGGSAIVNGRPFDAMFFDHPGVNPFVDAEDDSLSTFAIDVDDASYTLVRSYLQRGALPPEEAVRTEEFINHFGYNYPSTSRERFSVTIDASESRYARESLMLRIGVRAHAIPPGQRKDANLTFVIDISGSMARENRLGLVKRALRLLLENLTERDRVGIVVYGSRGEIRLKPASVSQRGRIISVIDALATGGSTNAEAGLRLGYQMARDMFDTQRINRVILCSDGVANVGVTGPDELIKQIREYAGQGITLSTIGFGMGNYNDELMEKLGDKGDGHYAYVDDIDAARRVFVDNLTGTLQVIARDVKAQVVFEPSVVRSYRLLGYENRDVPDDKFRDDNEDGGEVGSGHEVTALYELKLHWPLSELTVCGMREDQLGVFHLRYKSPNGCETIESAHNIDFAQALSTVSEMPVDYQLAIYAGEFAEILRDSYWAQRSKLDDLAQQVRALYQRTGDNDIEELAELVETAAQLRATLSEK